MRKDIFFTWFLYVVLISLLPLGINAILHFLADQSIFVQHNIFMGEVFFFTLMLSADTLKNTNNNKMAEKVKTVYNIAYFTLFVLIIFSAILFGLTVASDIFGNEGLPINKSRLYIFSIIMGISSFMVGLYVKIWDMMQI
ncbi:MAG: hypothetical protein FWE42_07755 [Defluviitaleaceae bacterium]|nr:hypothetical protein [Defluviitaleaceae bacterium]